MNPNENIEPLYAEASIESEDLTTSDVDICENEPKYKATSIEESLENVDTPPKEYDSTEVSECDILMSDYEELKAEFPELASLGDISTMEGAIRYGELRALGLTPREAYMAHPGFLQHTQHERFFLIHLPVHTPRTGPVQ